MHMVSTGGGATPYRTLGARGLTPYQCVVGARMASAGTFAVINHLDWRQPSESLVALADHTISLSLSPLPGNPRVRFVDGALDFVIPGPILFLPANMPLAGSCGGGPQTSLLCGISDHKLSSLAGRSSAIQGLDLRQFHDLPEAIFAATLSRIADELREPRLGSATAVELLVNMLFLDLVRHLDVSGSRIVRQVSQGGLTGWQLRRIQDRLHQEDAPPPTVGELATELGVSSRHLLRGFKSVTGVTLQQHIKASLEKRAFHLVVNTDTPLKVISQKLGFELPSSFSTAFRNSHGISPSELRRTGCRNLKSVSPAH